MDALERAKGVKVIDINNPMSLFPKPQRMFPADAPVKGGQYLSMPDKTDMTGHKSAAASIGIAEGGKPFFTASRDAVDETGTPGKGSAIAKTNLFKQKAGWKWKDAPEGHENTNTIVSVEHRGKHHYALNAHFPKGVDLARYEDSPSEPRLRPTTRGNVEFGPQAGSILVRGREHPVYHHVIVKSGGGDVEGYATKGYVDPASKHIQDWNWRPLEEVQNELGLHEIPSHVHEFGKFMDRTAERAGREGLTPRDLLKAYTITRASIQRRATPAENLHKSGLVLPPDVTGMVRPEGAFGHWLHTPAGQAYLDAASKGQTHEPAIQDAMERMKPFGKHNDLADALRWGAQNLPNKAAAVSHLVAAGREKASSPQEWRDFIGNIRGIGPSKAGFVASLMGRGDQPTLDARQIIMHTGRPSKEASAHIARKGGQGGEEAVDRLAARQSAMNLTTPKGMEPYYQHLAHHAVWDKAGNEMTTHQDVMDAMQHAARGGTIMDHPLSIVMHGLHPEGYEKGGGIGHNQGPSLEDDPRFREYMSRILDPRNPEHFEAAKKIAENYGVNDLSYSGFKKHPILPSQVTTQIQDIPGAIPKPVNPMSWHDFYRIGKGGVLFTLGGDRSNLGRLTHINGLKLGWPIDLHAGTKYQREANKNAVWANDKNAQKALLNNIKRVNDKGQEAYGAFAPMGTGAIDSSKNMTDAMMSHIAASKIDRDAMREFDNLIRSGQHVYNSTPGKPAHKEKTRQKRLADMQEWPGLEDPWAARNFAFQKMTGQERSGMIKLLDRADLLKSGFPSVAVTRAAVTDPELLHTSNNMTGGNIVRLSAEKHDPNDLSFIHSTYNTPTKGEYVGTVPFMPRHDVLPDFMQDQLMNPKYVNKSGPNKGEPLLVHSMSPNPMGRASIRGNTEMRQGIQPINERMLESIEQGQERIKKFGFNAGGRTAYKKGGKVEGSIWHDRDVFDDGGEVGQHESLNAVAGRTGENTEADATPPSYSDMPDNVQQAQLDLNNKGREANEATSARRAGESAAADAAFNAKNPDFNTPTSAETKAEEVQNPQAAPSAALSAEAMMSKAFGPTTSFGQQPPQAGLFTPEHFESTLEQNLVEPAFSQSMTQPAAPHTPTPTNDLTGIAAPAGTIDASPLGATTSNATTRGLRDAITQNLGPATVNTPAPTPVAVNTPSADLPASKIAGVPPAEFTPITPNPVGYFFDRMFGGLTSQGVQNPAGYSLGLPAGNPNAQQGQALLDQNARTPAVEGNRGSKTHMVQKLMPDGTYQWVEEPYKKGGRVYRRTVGSQMTDHVISKFGAKLPASNYQPTGNKAGRR